MGSAEASRHRLTSSRFRLRRRRYCGGLSIIYTIGLVVVLAAFASLAVDIGRIRLAASEVQVVADAAARAAADSLPITLSKTVENASDTADANGVIDEERYHATPNGARINPGVQLDPGEDIEFGTWDPTKPASAAWTAIAMADGPFQTSNDPRRKANAVNVTARRVRNRDSAIPLIFAKILPNGPDSTDINRDATAYISGGPSNFGFVGIDSVKAHGNGAAIDSAVYGKAGTGGGVGSDGTIDLGNADVYGDARPGIGQTVEQGPNSQVTGWMYPLDYKLADRYPPDAWNPPLTNNNMLISPQWTKVDFNPNGRTNYNFPANGKYYFKSWSANGGTTTINAPADIYIDTGGFTMSGSGTLKIHVTNPLQVVRIYVNGSFKQSGGNIINDSSSASSLYISMTAPGSVDLKGNPGLKAHINAPLSNVTCNGTSSFTGWIVGKTLDFWGTCNLHYDESKDDGRHYTITLVK